MINFVKIGGSAQTIREPVPGLPVPRAPLVHWDETRLKRLDQFVEGCRPIFPRADQVVRFRAYLRGLLEPLDRKNVEGIAAGAARALGLDSNLAQALQHFVSQSPWDSTRLFGALRKNSLDVRHDPDSVWVLHDVAFPKKGRHSVGVQRQFARGMGKKLNCQIGVFLVQVGPKGYFPLAARLYLPGHWLEENGDLAQKTIPEEHRRHVSKSEIALGLLSELKGEGLPLRPVAAEAGYLGSDDFLVGVKARGFSLRSELQNPPREALEKLGWLKAELGLDHFEGRTWQGWHHHVSLVFAAYYLLGNVNRESGKPLFRLLPR